MTGATGGAEIAYPSKSPVRVLWAFRYSIHTFLCRVLWTLFLQLCFFFSLLFCVSSDLRLLIIFDASHFLFISVCFSLFNGAVVVMIAWQLDLQLPMQSVPITIKIVNSNPAHDEVYQIQSLSETCGRSVVFSGYTGVSNNKTDRHDITEIFLNVALNTTTPTAQFSMPGK